MFNQDSVPMRMVTYLMVFLQQLLFALKKPRPKLNKHTIYNIIYEYI